MAISLNSRSNRLHIGPPTLNGAKLSVVNKIGIPIGDIRAFIRASGDLEAQISVARDLAASVDGVGSVDVAFSILHDLAADIDGTADVACLIDVVSWTPADITTTAWYDASDTSSISDTSGAVDQWNDKSGNGNHVTATTTARPTTNATTQNSLNVIDFNGTSNWLNGGDVLDLGTDSISVFIAYEVDADQRGLVGKTRAGSTVGRWSLAYYNSVSSEALYQGPGGNSFLDYTDSSSFPLKQIRGYMCDRVNGQMAGSLDGTYFTGDSFTPDTGTSCDNTLKFKIGAAGDAADNPNIHMIGSIYEIVIVKSAGIVSTDDRQKIEGYLAHKWGLEGNLPADHPYKSVAP